MNNEHLQNVISFVSQKGFIWGPEPEIYNGLSGFYTYGPLGKLLKNKVEDTIRKDFVRSEFFEVECPIVLPKKVWEASGHLGGFSDPMVECTKCESRFRIDELIGEKVPELKDKVKAEDYQKVIKKHKIMCPSCNELFKEEITQHSLMLKTTIGMGTEAYCRPETATASYLPFPRYADFFRHKLPFGVFQIGKAFRNEISPRQYLIRLREFTQAEGQLFMNPDEKKSFYKFDLISDNKLPLVPEKNQGKEFKIDEISLKQALSKKYIKSKAYGWTLNLAYDLYVNLGIPKERIRIRQHRKDEMAFYADDAWDIEVNLNSFGWQEMCGVHDRTDYDLVQHEKFSGKKLEVNDNGIKIKPHVLEIAFGTDRPVFALLDIFYEKKEEGQGKSILSLPLEICPIQAAVLPLFRKDNMPETAKLIAENLREEFSIKYDETQSIGKRYLRAAEEAIPFCVTVDYDTLKDKTVTLRDRDSEKQVRFKIDDLNETLKSLFSKTKTFDELEAKTI
ncbi:MAG: glycine--tRNA ligase [Nanoarchaeota archaeon]|nr:glycine--tRNA ligase [Nanoarchaeota archaeon]